MKHFDHIVFDVDGTLADTEESVLSSLAQIVQEETGKTLPRNELEFALGIPGKNALEKLGIYSQATLDRWYHVAASFKSTISVFPGLLEVIAKLADSGCNLGIVSSRARDEYAEEIAPLGSIRILSTSSLSKTQPNTNPHPHPCSNISDVRAQTPTASSTLATPSTTNNAQLQQGSVLPEQHGDHTKTSQTPPTTSKPPTTC